RPGGRARRAPDGRAPGRAEETSAGVSRTGGAPWPGEGCAVLDVLVAGLVCRDLVVAVVELPDSGSAPVTTRIETLGGAANIAVASRQLGLSAGLVGVLGQDGAAELVLDRARQDGIDVTAVVQ